MKRTFGSTPVAIELDGNQYHVPDSLSGIYEIAAKKEIEAYEAAARTEAQADYQVNSFGANLTDEQKANPDGLAAEVEKRLDAQRAAGKAVGEAAKKLVLKLIRPSVEGQEIPKSLGDHISTVAALDYAATLLGDGRVAFDDPQ